VVKLEGTVAKLVEEWGRWLLHTPRTAPVRSQLYEVKVFLRAQYGIHKAQCTNPDWLLELQNLLKYIQVVT